MKRVAVLESNLSSAGFLGMKLCKEAGFETTFFTRNFEKYAAIPNASEIIRDNVDKVVVCETNDIDVLWEQVQAEQQFGRFDAFVTISEYYSVIAATIAQKLGVPHLNPDAARKSRNKHLTRLACADAGVPIPKFAAVSSAKELIDSLDEIGLPWIIKPADEAASADVVKCYSVEQAVGHYGQIVGKERNARGQARYQYVLVEQCIKGHEVSVETMTVGGVHHVYGVTDKMLAGARNFVEVGHAFPSALPPGLIRECERVAKAALDAIGYDLGVAHVEIKIDQEGAKLIEINGRPAGDRITDLVKLVTGRDPIDDHFHLLLGHMPGLPGSAHESGAAISFFTAPPGRIDEIAGLNEIKYCDAITDFSVDELAGKVVAPLTSSSTRLGHVIAVGGNSYEAWKRAETARQMLCITTVN
jgi:biotin carboxylase